MCIITITPNTCIDNLTICTDGERPEQVTVPAGGGVNVARALATFRKRDSNRRNRAHRLRSLGFVGFGELNLFTSADTEMVVTLTAVDGPTRISEIHVNNGLDEHAPGRSGFIVDKRYLEQLWAQLRDMIPGDTLVLTGSLPSGAPANFYAQTIAWVRLLHPGVRIVLDARAENLLPVFASSLRPDVWKPNLAELQAVVGEKVDPQDTESLLRYAQTLLPDSLAVFSLGREGIFAHLGGEAWRMRCNFEQRVRSPVGCGDSLVAGIVYGLDQGFSVTTSLKWGLAASAANTQNAIPGDFDLETVNKYRKQISVSKVARSPAV